MDEKNYYFDNDYVERLCRKYVLGGTVDIKLRDEILTHAQELIENIIRVNKFVQIINHSDYTTFDELLAVATESIESSLYKFNITNKYILKNGKVIIGQIISENDKKILLELQNHKHKLIKKSDIKSIRRFHTKIFGFWSQVAKTSILAYIKKDKRDFRNKERYLDYLIHKNKTIRKYHVSIESFIDKCKKIFVDKTSHKILDSLMNLYINDKFSKSFIKDISIDTGLSTDIIRLFFDNMKNQKELFDEFLTNVELNKIDYRDSNKEENYNY